MILSENYDTALTERVEALNSSQGASEAQATGTMEKRAYSVDDIMLMLDVSRSSVYTLIRRKAFKSIKIGNQLRIPKKGFDAWLDTQ